MFAGYYFADQVQRYRASPHKSRIDHVAPALISRQYLKEVVAQHLREWLRFTTDCDARGIVLPQTVHAREVQDTWRDVCRAGARVGADSCARQCASSSKRMQTGCFVRTCRDGGGPRGAWVDRVRPPGAYHVSPGASRPRCAHGAEARVAVDPDGRVLGPDGGGDVARAARLTHSAVLSPGGAPEARDTADVWRHAEEFLGVGVPRGAAAYGSASGRDRRSPDAPGAGAGCAGDRGRRPRTRRGRSIACGRPAGLRRSCSPSATGCARPTFGSSASTMCSGDGD